MKRIICAALALLMLLSLCACGSKKDEGKTLTLGFDAEYPPYGYKDEATGEYVGYDLELAAEVCKRLGWTLVPQPIDWDSKDMELSAGTIDLIWNGMTMTGREDEYTWIGPYVDNSIVFVVNEGSGITSKADLAGKTVITQSGSSALTALTDDPGDGSNDENLALAASFSKLEQIADYNNAFMNLETGVVDAVAVDVGVANYQLESRNSGAVKFVMLDEPLSTEQYGIAFEKGNTVLANTVKEKLDEMYKDGTFAKITETWGLSDMSCYDQAAVR